MSTAYMSNVRLFLRAIIIAERGPVGITRRSISHFCHSRAGRLGFAPIMVAIELGLEPDGIVERQGSDVVRFYLEARARGPLLFRPRRQAGDDPPGIAASLPPGTGDHRFVAQQAIVDGAIGQRDKLAIDRKRGGRSSRPRADSPARPAARRDLGR